jgi:RNA polymerase sigma-70 factor (ECF subfamily)
VTESLADILHRLIAGDPAAANSLYERFVRRLIHLAARELGHKFTPAADPEAVAQSVLHSFFHRHQQGQLRFDTWEMVYAWLARVTIYKCHNRRRDLSRQKRDPGLLVSLEDWQTADREPSPEEEAILREQLAAAFVGFDPEEQRLIRLHLDGKTTEQLAELSGLTTRTVQRTLKAFRDQLEDILRVEEARD